MGVRAVLTHGGAPAPLQQPPAAAATALLPLACCTPPGSAPLPLLAPRRASLLLCSCTSAAAAPALLTRRCTASCSARTLLAPPPRCNIQPHRQSAWGCGRSATALFQPLRDRGSSVAATCRPSSSSLAIPVRRIEGVQLLSTYPRPLFLSLSLSLSLGSLSPSLPTPRAERELLPFAGQIREFSKSTAPKA